MYKFTLLDSSQRKDFQTRWWHLHKMFQKWTKAARPGEVHDVFANKKDLEREIIDLEDISLAAYRAMKYLRQHLESIKNEDSKLPLHKNGFCSSCGMDLGGVKDYVSMYNIFFCSSHCLTEFEQYYESENYSG